MIIADTGFFLALANARDRHHARASEVARGLSEALITTWPVLAETCHLLVSRLGVKAELAFLSGIGRGAVNLFDLQLQHLSQIEALMERYASLPMDLADASLVVLADSMGSGRILSTDQRDFQTYRWKHRKPFRNLLLD